MIHKFLSLLGVLSILVASHSANLLVDGDFESYSSLTNGQYSTISTDVIPGWTLVSGSVDACRGLPGYPTGNATVFCDLAGDSNGEIQQNFTTIPGTNYLVSLTFASAPMSPQYATSMSVSIPGITNKTLTTPVYFQGVVTGNRTNRHDSTQFYPGWFATNVFTFTAVSNSHAIKLQATWSSGTGLINSSGPLVDDVSVDLAP